MTARDLWEAGNPQAPPGFVAWGEAVSGGLITRAQVTSDQGPITALVDLTGLTITFTAPAGQRIRVEGRALFRAQNSSEPSVARLLLTDGANAIKDFNSSGFALTSTLGDNATRLHVTFEFVGDGASHTYKLRALGAGGDGVVMRASSNRHAVIAAFDDGPE